MSEKKTGICEEIEAENRESCKRRRIAFDQVLAVLDELRMSERGVVIRAAAAFYGQELSR